MQQRTLTHGKISFCMAWQKFISSQGDSSFFKMELSQKIQVNIRVPSFAGEKNEREKKNRGIEKATSRGG